MADFYSIPLEEMNAFLRSRRFQPVDLTYRNRPVLEWVYERPLPRQPNHVVRVYTGINRYGRSQNQSRGAGKDAIRVQVIYKKGDVETLVTQPKRVHRVTGWADNLDNRLTEIAQSLPQVVFDRRGEPMTLRRKNGKYFWGSRDYPKYKETKPFRAEGGNQVIRFDTLEEFHKYVKEHPYYDVEDAKRRVLMRAESREEFQQFSQTQPVIILDFECYAWRGLKADTVGVAYNHVVPLSNVSFQNLGGNLLPRDLIKEYGEPQSAAFIFNQDYQERNRSYGYLQNMKINLKGIPFSINWSWSYPEKLELWLWKIPLNSIENQDELNFTDIVKLNPIEGRMWNQHQQRRELYAAEEFNSEQGAPLLGQTTEAPYEIKVYVPSTTLDQPISDRDFKSRIEETQEKLSELFGGFTTVDASGGYLSQQDGVISEPIIVVSSWATVEDYQSRLDDLERFLKQKKDDWGQEVIGFEFENDFFMYPEFRAEEIRCCQECDKTTGLTTIQAGTYCYDCLPINLGAESEAEWGGLPVHEINSLEELIDIFESRYATGVGKKVKRTNYELLTNSLFKINFSGVYGVRTIDGPSKVIYGINLLQSNKVNQGMQLGGLTILSQTYPDADVVSVEIPFIPTANLPRSRSKESKLEDLIEMMKPHGGWKRKSNKNTIIFDMRGTVFAADLHTNWDITQSGIKFKDMQLLKRNGWRPLNFTKRRQGRASLFGEIEILGGVPQENIVYEEIPPVALNPLEVTMKNRYARYVASGRLKAITGEDGSILSNFNSLSSYSRGIPTWDITMTDEDLIEHWNQFAAEDDIKLFYEGIYENDGGFGDGKEMKSYSVVSKKDYRDYYEDTKWNPCECDEQGCLSCFLNEYPHRPQFTEGSIVEYGSLWFEDNVWGAEDEIPIIDLNSGVEFSEQNPEKIEADAPPDWRESIITIPQSDSFGYALYRKMSDLTYNQVWRVLEIIDDLNRMSHHHALTKFSSNYVEIWIYSHDSGLVTPKDYHWAEDFNDMIATVDWQMWESETEWDDVDWENEKPVKPKNDWGDDIEWDAEDDWGSLRPETRPEFPTVDAKIASMLRNHSKVNVNGEQGCPRCGHEDLFYRESTGTGTKWYCYGCFYTEKTESQKSQKVITLEKYGLKVRCPDCNEMIVAYNQASVNSHRKKCGVTK